MNTCKNLAHNSCIGSTD